MSSKNREIAKQNYAKVKGTIENYVVSRTIEKIIGQWDWDYYRFKYLRGDYTWDELIQINDWLYKLTPSGREFFHKDWADMFFSLVDGNVSVNELGCGEGLLAKHCLEKHSKINQWDGYDISTVCLSSYSKNGDNYQPYALSVPFWDIDLSNYREVFIASHTIEHISIVEFIKLAEKLVKYKWVYIEAPLTVKGKIWKRGGSTHVFNRGSRFVRKQMRERGFTPIFEGREGMNWACGWKNEKRTTPP